jgi:hypothetical protein
MERKDLPTANSSMPAHPIVSRGEVAASLGHGKGVSAWCPVLSGVEMPVTGNPSVLRQGAGLAASCL